MGLCASAVGAVAAPMPKPIIMTPAVFRKSRREGSTWSSAPSAVSESGAAPSSLEGFFGFGAGGVRVIADERIAVQDEAAHAVAALHSLLPDKRLLNGMQIARVRKVVEGPQTFKGSDAVLVGVGHRRNAGADRPSVEQHGA